MSDPTPSEQAAAIRARAEKNAKSGILSYSNGDVSISKLTPMDAEDHADRIERREQRRLRGFKSVVDMGGPR